MALEAVYEQDFLNCSYGFRPGRSAHQALSSFRNQMMEMHGGWVIEVDIRKFFDTLDHRHLQQIVRQRVRDGTLLRLIGKWLNAGVVDDGILSFPEAGTPQGGVISPLLANIYLHEVLDTWFECVVKPRLSGRAFLVRYADDFLIGFSDELDARRVMTVLPKRFEKYGLTLHPEKTRLLRFLPPWRGGESESFDLLGFTHIWAKSRKGNWVIRQRTAKERFRRAVKAIAVWCRTHRHQPLKEPDAGNLQVRICGGGGVKRQWRGLNGHRSGNAETRQGHSYSLNTASTRRHVKAGGTITWFWPTGVPSSPPRIPGFPQSRRAP